MFDCKISLSPSYLDFILALSDSFNALRLALFTISRPLLAIILVVPLPAAANVVAVVDKPCATELGAATEVPATIALVAA